MGKPCARDTVGDFKQKSQSNCKNPRQSETFDYEIEIG